MTDPTEIIAHTIAGNRTATAENIAGLVVKALADAGLCIVSKQEYMLGVHASCRMTGLNAGFG